MKTTTLSDYLAQNPDSKKIQKRLARAIKTYRHAARDLSHASDDVAHAKEDCLHAMQMFDVALDDCQQGFAEWAKADLEEEIHLIPAETPEDAPEDGDPLDLDEEDDEEDLDEHPASQGDNHLRHASKDFSAAIQDAESVLEELCKVENLLLDILEIAREEGLSIDLTDAKAYVVAKAAEPAPDLDQKSAP